MDVVSQKAASCDTTAVLAFASVASYRGNLALPGPFPGLVDKLAVSGKPIILVSLGNPYLVRNFPQVTAYIAAFSPVPTSEIAAVKALYGEIEINGHHPVTIPGVADFGFGIHVTRK
jgi:beta-N-acetylhexosaminidase